MALSAANYTEKIHRVDEWLPHCLRRLWRKHFAGAFENNRYPKGDPELMRVLFEPLYRFGIYSPIS